MYKHEGKRCEKDKVREGRPGANKIEDPAPILHLKLRGNRGKACVQYGKWAGRNIPYDKSKFLHIPL